MYTILTAEIIEKARSKSGGWSKDQLKKIDVEWPPPKGWKKRSIGKSYSQKKIEQFLSLKDEHL